MTAYRGGVCLLVTSQMIMHLLLSPLPTQCPYDLIAQILIHAYPPKRAMDFVMTSKIILNFIVGWSPWPLQ